MVEMPRLDINYCDEYGTTAAHLACYNGEAECVKILADILRVDWNKADDKGKTPLYLAMEAVENGYTDILKSDKIHLIITNGQTLDHIYF